MSSPILLSSPPPPLSLSFLVHNGQQRVSQYPSQFSENCTFLIMALTITLTILLITGFVLYLRERHIHVLLRKEYDCLDESFQAVSAGMSGTDIAREVSESEAFWNQPENDAGDDFAQDTQHMSEEEITALRKDPLVASIFGIETDFFTLPTVEWTIAYMHGEDDDDIHTRKIMATSEKTAVIAFHKTFALADELLTPHIGKDDKQVYIFSVRESDTEGMTQPYEGEGRG
jgi:hypothetical protein